ncbi:MAG TPA: phosphatidylglycerophosphatase A [Elusimicrobiales bacterium]|nr:phosphatidylglycerophosphatase A [Elusimicrobiales bacterium]
MSERNPGPLARKAAEFLATGCFIGLLPQAVTPFKKCTGAGLLGSLLALLALPLLPSGWAYAALLAAFFPFSAWIAGRASADYGRHDDPRIVIDEVLGFWTAAAFLPLEPAPIVTAFVVFRILDSVKPWPISYAEKNLQGGFGIIMDDFMAGIAANLTARFVAVFLL